MAFWKQARRLTALPNPPSLIEYRETGQKDLSWRFLIMDAPTDANIHLYIPELKTHDISVVVRTCEATYSAEKLESEDIQCLDLPFPDGCPPSTEIIMAWLDAVDTENRKRSKAIAVHCVAGLGRSPVLVAIALMELAHCPPMDAIAKIRSARRGAFTQKQAQWLRAYEVTRKERCCVIM